MESLTQGFDLSWSQVLGLTAALVLLLWGIGARSRLARLRTHVREAYIPLEQLVCQRHDRLCALAIDVGPALREQTERIHELTAACEHASVAAQDVRVRAWDARRLKAYEDAERAVNQAFAGLLRAIESQPRVANDRQVRRQRTELQSTQSAIAFARDRFNESIGHYNDALAIAPTRWLAWLLRMRPGLVLKGGVSVARHAEAGPLASGDGAHGGARLRFGEPTLEVLKAAHPTVPDEAWAPTQIAKDD